MTTKGKTGRRLVIITNERGAADDSLSYMMGFAISISAKLDILIICSDSALKQSREGTSKTANAAAVDAINNTGRRYGIDVSVELYCKSRMLTMKDDVESKKGLTMVLLSPALNNDRVFDLRKILQGVPVPVWQYRTRPDMAITGRTGKGGTHHEQVKEDINRG